MQDAAPASQGLPSGRPGGGSSAAATPMDSTPALHAAASPAEGVGLGPGKAAGGLQPGSANAADEGDEDLDDDWGIGEDDGDAAGLEDFDDDEDLDVS